MAMLYDPLTDIFSFFLFSDEDARPLAEKYLHKWRPGFADAHATPDNGPSGNGSQEVTA